MVGLIKYLPLSLEMYVRESAYFNPFTHFPVSSSKHSFKPFQKLQDALPKPFSHPPPRLLVHGDRIPSTRHPPLTSISSPLHTRRLPAAIPAKFNPPRFARYYRRPCRRVRWCVLGEHHFHSTYPRYRPKRRRLWRSISRTFHHP